MEVKNKKATQRRQVLANLIVFEEVLICCSYIIFGVDFEFAN